MPPSFNVSVNVYVEDSQAMSITIFSSSASFSHSLCIYMYITGSSFTLHI